MARFIFIADRERGIVTRDGRFVEILMPGEHRFRNISGRANIERVVAQGVFVSPWAVVIEKCHPQIAAEHFEIVRASEGEIAVVYEDEVATFIVRPGQLAYVWRGLKTVRVERFDVEAKPRLTRAQLIALEKATTIGFSAAQAITIVSVEEAQAAVVFFDGALAETLGPGRYGYWSVGRRVTVKAFDTRPVPIEVTAQEILTRDRISLRVTLTSFVQVTDVERAALGVPDYSSHIYKLVQFAVREAVGGRVLDEVLNDRVTVDAQIVEHVRRGLGDIGVAVTELGIKDVILPGEMRELINKVVEAEKLAQANLIRRREETAATRSLLNTARLMEGNPVLMRLKELETLERVTEKIGRIDVQASSGEGLNAVLDRLVHLRPPAK